VFRIATATRRHIAVYSPYLARVSDRADAAWGGKGVGGGGVGGLFPWVWECAALVSWADGASALAWHPLALQLAVCSADALSLWCKILRSTLCSGFV
jgi:hypothetical protein